MRMQSLIRSSTGSRIPSSELRLRCIASWGPCICAISNPMPEPAIQVCDVVKRYGSRTVLDRIRLDVFKGVTLVILGGSGSGKSTLLRLMIGNVRPDAGDIDSLGRSIARMSD